MNFLRRFLSTLGILAVFVSTGPAGYASEQEAVIREALVAGCFATFPTFVGMEAWARDKGWDIHAGADEGEFATGNGDLTIYVYANAEAGTNQGCSVRHEIVDQTSAVTLLEEVLRDRFSGQWTEEKGWNDSRVWRVRGSGPMLQISVDAGGGGNSGVGPGSGITIAVKE